MVTKYEDTLDIKWHIDHDHDVTRLDRNSYACDDCAILFTVWVVREEDA